MKQEEEIVLRLLKSIGIPEEKAKESYKDLLSAFNAVTIDHILKSLTPEEQIKLKQTLDEGPKTAEFISQTCRKACEESANKVDVDEVTDKAIIEAYQSFWKMLYTGLEDEQKKKFEDEYAKILNEDANLKDKISSKMKIVGE